MCSTIINEVSEKLEEATAQLNSQILIAAPYIADDLPYTFHTNDTFELLLDVYELLKSAQVQVEELKLMENTAPSIYETPFSSVGGSFKSSKMHQKKLVEGCSQTDNSTFFTECKSRMADAQLQTGRNGISTTGIDIDLTPRRPKSRIKSYISREPTFPECLVEEDSDTDDTCCYCCSFKICKALRPASKKDPSQKYAIPEGTQTLTEVDYARQQAEHRVVVEAINKIKKPTLSLINPCNQSSQKGRTNSTKNIVQNGYINPLDSVVQDTTTHSIQFEQLNHIVKDAGLAEHPPESKPTAESLVRPQSRPTAESLVRPKSKLTAESLVRPESKPTAGSLIRPQSKPTTESLLHPELKPTAGSIVRPESKPTAESLIPKVSAIKSPKLRRAPDPPLKNQFQRQETNRSASEPAYSKTRNTRSHNVEYPADMDPFEDDSIPAAKHYSSQL